MLIETFNNQLAKDILGTKSYNLLHLKSKNILIPNFFVIDPLVFNYWKINKTLPNEFSEILHRKLQEMNTQYFSVRSSMNLEDGENDSFAGMLETYLFVKKEDITKYIEMCFESISNERVQSYLSHKNIANKNLAMSVVVQVMIDSQASGVVFTRSPVIDNGLILVESGLGLGEGIVSGLVEVDQFLLDRKYNLIKKEISTKTKMIKKGPGLTSIFEVPIEDSKRESIKVDKVIELGKICIEIEKIYHGPCDIEWALYKDEIYILQARPITQRYDPLELYIDTNLSESYPGRTSPFTGSFVTKMYDLVHQEIGEYLKFSTKRLDLLRPYFSTMTTYINGHMYYRLKSYYSLLLSIPGGKQNLTNWHRMIGASHEYFDLETNQITPTFLETIFYYLSILKLVIFHDNIFNKFNLNGKKDLKKLHLKLDASKGSIEISRTIIESVTKSYGFGLTGLNDLLAMKGLNKIVSFLDKHDIDQKILTQIIKTNDTVESLLPLIDMQKLRQNLSENFIKAFEKSLNEDNQVSSHKKIQYALDRLSNNFKLEVIFCQEYLSKYGHRSFEELKIESLSLFHDPKEFLKLLKERNEFKRKNKLEHFDIRELKINFLDQTKLKIISHFTQKFIKRREQARLLRGSFYSFVRISMINLYDKLIEEKAISKEIPLENIFELTLSNLEDYIKGIEITNKLTVKKNNKRVQYPEYYFKEFGKTQASYFDQVFERPELTSDKISGLGASSGEIKAKVLIVHDPKEITDTKMLNEYILVTQNTDPAWIHLMSNSKGLISEKGSLLSHTAIIGREMNIPTIVGVINATRILKNNQLIMMDAKTGIITLLEDSNED